jgi:hypothetical protein
MIKEITAQELNTETPFNDRSGLTIMKASAA